MSTPRQDKPSVLLVGGGIGGMAAALALARLGISIDLLEQSAAIGEIGAGLQLGPNAFAALDALGVGEAVRRGAVFTDRLVMMDAVDCSEVASVPVGEAFRARFGNPYAVSHRADLHGAIHEAVQAASADPLPHLGAGRAAGHRRAAASRPSRATAGASRPMPSSAATASSRWCARS